jgi:hypothetical protein
VVPAAGPARPRQLVLRVEPPALAGKRQRLRRGGYSTCTQALQARAALLAEPRGLAAGRAWTLERWLNQWLLDMRDFLRLTTVDGYRKHVQLHLIPMLGHVKLADLTTQQVQAMLRSLAARRTREGGPIAAGTVVRILATLRSALSAAVREGLIATNPAAHARPPRPRGGQAVL